MYYITRRLVHLNKFMFHVHVHTRDSLRLPTADYLRMCRPFPACQWHYSANLYLLFTCGRVHEFYFLEARTLSEAKTQALENYPPESYEEEVYQFLIA